MFVKGADRGGIPPGVDRSAELVEPSGAGDIAGLAELLGGVSGDASCLVQVTDPQRLE